MDPPFFLQEPLQNGGILHQLGLGMRSEVIVSHHWHLRDVLDDRCCMHACDQQVQAASAAGFAAGDQQQDVLVGRAAGIGSGVRFDVRGATEVSAAVIGGLGDWNLPGFAPVSLYPR